MNPLALDIFAFIIFITLTVGYHSFYALVMGHHRDWSARARMHEHRLHWVEMISKRGERIMAVQALRNLIMTNTFLASTMILMVAFLTNFIVSDTAREFLKPHPEPTFLSGAMPLTVKAILLLTIYGFAFISFMTSLRNLTQLTLFVGLDPDQIKTTEGRDAVQFVTKKLSQVDDMTSYGRRAVYFSLPVFGWYFSPWIFASATILIWVLFIYRSDFVNPLKTAKPEPAAPVEAATPPPQNVPASK